LYPQQTEGMPLAAGPRLLLTVSRPHGSFQQYADNDLEAYYLNLLN
jgi:hypothetical protein